MRLEAEDYKDWLRAKIQENKKVAGYKRRLAEAMGTPASFLSQVLHSSTELSLDHGLRLSRYWSLTPIERDYFLTLILKARASTPELRRHLEEKLSELRKTLSDLSRRFEQPALEQHTDQWDYYSSWQPAALHLLLTIPAYQKSTRAMAERLEIHEALVSVWLGRLKQMALVEQLRDGRWVPTKKSLHLPKDSPVSPTNHLLWRLRAVEAVQKRKWLTNHERESLHYTALQTLSLADFQKLREFLLSAIERTRREAVSSREELLVCLNLDWFEV